MSAILKELGRRRHRFMTHQQIPEPALEPLPNLWSMSACRNRIRRFQQQTIQNVPDDPDEYAIAETAFWAGVEEWVVTEQKKYFEERTPKEKAHNIKAREILLENWRNMQIAWDEIFTENAPTAEQDSIQDDPFAALDEEPADPFAVLDEETT